MSMDLLGAVSKTFRYYVKLFGVLFPVALVVNAALTLIVGGVVVNAEDLSELIVGAIVVIVAALVGASLVTAVSTNAVGDLEDGQRDNSLGRLLALAGPVIGSVVGVSILQGIGVAVGVIALIIPGVLALTWWAVAVPAVVIERTGVAGAFTRSVQLVRGNAWNVFGYGLTMVLVALAGTFILDEGLAPALADFLGAVATAILLDSLMTPLVAVGYAVLYFELRRLEGSPDTQGDTWFSAGDESA